MGIDQSACAPSTDTGTIYRGYVLCTRHGSNDVFDLTHRYTITKGNPAPPRADSPHEEGMLAAAQRIANGGVLRTEGTRGPRPQIEVTYGPRSAGCAFSSVLCCGQQGTAAFRIRTADNVLEHWLCTGTGTHASAVSGRGNGMASS